MPVRDVELWSWKVNVKCPFQKADHFGDTYTPTESVYVIADNMKSAIHQAKVMVGWRGELTKGNKTSVVSCEKICSLGIYVRSR